MKKVFTLFLLLACLSLVSCAPANITSVKWDTGLSGDKLETRCERVDMRDQKEMNKVFAKYDGWKLVYISEYTTQNKIGTDCAVCFERIKPE